MSRLQEAISAYLQEPIIQSSENKFFQLLDVLVLKSAKQDKRDKEWLSFVNETLPYEKKFFDRLKKFFLKQGQDVLDELDRIPIGKGDPGSGNWDGPGKLRYQHEGKEEGMHTWVGGKPWDDDLFEENAKQLNVKVHEDKQIDRLYIVTNKKIILYHATSKSFVDNIFQNGIRQSSGKGSISGVYLGSKDGVSTWRGKDTTLIGVRIPKGERLYQDVQPNAIFIRKDIPKEWLFKLGQKSVPIGNIVTKDLTDLLTKKHEWDIELRKLLEEMFPEIILNIGNKTMVQLGGGTDIFDVMTPGILEFVDDWALKLSFDINDETTSNLKNVLQEGIAGGESMGKIRNRIQTVFTDMSNYRAARIARTETIRASNYAAEESYIQSGVVEGKEWLAAMDERLCAFCSSMDGKFIPLGKNFLEKGSSLSVVDMEDATRTLTMSINYTAIKAPPLHPSCRCSLIPRIIPDADITKVPRKPRILKPKEPLFPNSFDDLTPLESAGGTTGARFYSDAMGNKYIGKYGKTKEHLLNECQADKVYQAMGINVPEFKLYDTAKGPVKVTRFIKGRMLNDFLNTASDAEIAMVKKELQKGFATDALLANWDVIGTGYDNILLDVNYKSWRIDNGGSFMYRAQGGKKLLIGNTSNVWDTKPYEIWSMRKRDNIMRAPNEFSSFIFKDLEYTDVVDQMSHLVANKTKILKAIDDPLARVTVRGRLESMAELTKIHDNMAVKDFFMSDYVDRFSENLIAMRRHGVFDTLPQQLKYEGTQNLANRSVNMELPRNTYDILYDENHKYFGNLQDSFIYSTSPLGKYCNDFRINIEKVNNWLNRQSVSSWRTDPIYAKAIIMKNTRISKEEFFWDPSYLNIDNDIKNVQDGFQKELEKALITNHAYTYEILNKVKIQNINPQKGTLQLIRGVDSNALERNYGVIDQGLYPAGWMNNAVYESSSLFHIPKGWVGSVYGRLIYEDVPIHRVLSSYITKRMFTDEENEFLGIFHNLPFRKTSGETWVK